MRGSDAGSTSPANCLGSLKPALSVGWGFQEAFKPVSLRGAAFFFGIQVSILRGSSFNISVFKQRG
jgi:hypothetical protein